MICATPECTCEHDSRTGAPSSLLYSE